MAFSGVRLHRHPPSPQCSEQGIGMSHEREEGGVSTDPEEAVASPFTPEQLAWLDCVVEAGTRGPPASAPVAAPPLPGGSGGTAVASQLGK